MSEIYYDYKEYWKHEGKLSKRDSLSFQLTKEHEAQEKPLIDEVKKVNPKSILEIGAGWGRILNLLRNSGVESDYTAIDLSYDRLSQIEDKTVTRKVIDFMDYEEKHFDLILAVEVLMHIPPDILKEFIDKMKRMANTIITIDYDPHEPREIKLADHNFLHDYDVLFPNSDTNQISYVQKMRIYE